MSFQRLLVLTVAGLITLTPAGAGDWPQILGINRDGVAVDEELLSEWPQDGLRELWSAEVGQGFAGTAVKGGTLVLFHRVGDQEVVEARNAATGKKLWQTSFPCDYQSGISSDSGPRCVPLISADRVFVFGVMGNLRCLQLNDGSEIWQRDTQKDFSPPEGYFGAGSTPLLAQDLLIVNVGSRDNAAVVAFSAADGRTQWQSFSDTASYSAPILAEVNGVNHTIVVTRLNTVSLNPEDGSVRFSFPFGMRGPTVNGATPVVMGHHVFVSSSYRIGSAWAELVASGKASVVNSGEDLLATQYATPVRQGNLLYAVDGRQDAGTATVKCIDPENQKVLWEESGFDYGTLIRVNDEILFLTCGGELIRFAADRNRYQEISRISVLNPTPSGYRLPALSDGRLFVRDDKRLRCLQVGKP